jgi:large subunit ribosomal protein L5
MAAKRLATRLSVCSNPPLSSSAPFLARAKSGVLKVAQSGSPLPPSETPFEKGSDPATFTHAQPTAFPTSAADMKQLVVGPHSSPRLRDFYHNQLEDDLLYLTYDHPRALDPDLPNYNPTALEKDPTNPFKVNQRPKSPRGKRANSIPVRKNVDESNVVRIESITIHTMVSQAVKSKSQLLGAIHALRTITGLVEGSRGDRLIRGVQVIKAKKGAATWSLRVGMPIGTKVKLVGDDAYRFLESLTEFVLPRLREWPGLRLHHGRNEDPTLEGATSGTVSFGFGPEAMALFPQIESCLDSYPRMYGFDVNVQTNQQGFGAQDRARTLLSGFRIPFYKPIFIKSRTKVAFRKQKFGKGGK